ncbi:MAG: hypothetical protein J3K34DRAFT_410927 [Monoraphidium minutum]|nr:MAG: hypothetical protein J3K34DRAFT_410927 [Monoraphidium minutum]
MLARTNAPRGAMPRTDACSFFRCICQTLSLGPRRPTARAGGHVTAERRSHWWRRAGNPQATPRPRRPPTGAQRAARAAAPLAGHAARGACLGPRNGRGPWAPGGPASWHASRVPATCTARGPTSSACPRKQAPACFLISTLLRKARQRCARAQLYTRTFTSACSARTRTACPENQTPRAARCPARRTQAAARRGSTPIRPVPRAPRSAFTATNQLLGCTPAAAPFTLAACTAAARSWGR